MRASLSGQSDFNEKRVMNNKNKKVLSGATAAAEALRQIAPDVMAVYPITPQTAIIETYSKFKADGLVSTEMIQAESEHSAISACVGASAAGARTVTASSSQGIALMHEILYIASGMRLPILMAVSARALSSPINIHGDHSDVMGSRDSGWMQIFAENPQEAYDNTVVGMKLAEKVELPIMSIMDGFNTSHCLENVEILDDAKVKKFLGNYKPEKSLLNVKNPMTFGPLALQDSYFEFKIDQEKAMENAKAEFLKIAKEYKKISGKEIKFFEEYETKDAETILIMMGSATGTAKNVIDELRNAGKKVGLIKINLFRPFPQDELVRALKKSKEIIVLDRAQSIGTDAPLFMEVVNSLKDLKSKKKLTSYIYGLGGRDLFGDKIKNLLEGKIKEKYLI